MTYGFKFYNNSDPKQLIIDDNNVKPWYITDQWVGLNYQNTEVTDNFNFNELKITPPSNNPSDWYHSTETWRVYKLEYVAPNNFNSFAVFTLPDANAGIWYSVQDGGPEVDPYQITLIPQAGGYYPTFYIYALVPQSWIATATTADITAAIPKVYFYAKDGIPSGSLGTGYGVQVFNSNSNCVFDSKKRHIQIKNYSFITSQIPGPTGQFGPDYNGGTNISTYASAPTSSATSAFLIPFSQMEKYSFATNPADAYIRQSRVFYQRVTTSANTLQIRTRNIDCWTYTVQRVNYPGIASGTYLNYGMESVQPWNSSYSFYYASILQVDSAPLDRGYTAAEFPAGYSLSVSTTDDGTGNRYEYEPTAANPFIPVYTVNINLTTTQVTDGTTVPFTISGTGITTSDFSQMIDAHRTSWFSNTSFTPTLSSYFTVRNNLAVINISFAQDTILEGTETLTLTLNNGKGSISVQIKEAKGYSLAWTSPNTTGIFAEGTTAVVTLSTKNITNGTVIPWIITPFGTATQPDAADFGGSLTGNFTVTAATNSSVGTASASIPITADFKTENTEYFTLSIPSANGITTSSITGQISDTSQPTFSITSPYAGTGDIYTDEYPTANWSFTVTTVGLPDGTVIYPTILSAGIAGQNDINSADFYASWWNGTTNSGVVVTNNTATINIAILPDNVTEEPEAFKIGVSYPIETLKATYPGVIYINDNSQTNEIYSVTPATQTVNENTQVSFSMTANDDYGHSVFWTLEGTGIDLNDISSMRYLNPSWIDNGLPQYQTLSKSLQGTFTFPDTLDKILQVTIANDLATEGREYMTFKLRPTSYTSAAKATSVITINDTSRGAVNETVTATSYSVVYPSGINVTWAGGYPNDTVLYSVDSEAYDQVFTLDANGSASNPNAATNYAVGTHTAYFYYQGSGHYRTITWTVMPDYSIVPTVTSVNEGGSVRWNVTAPVPDGTYLYWTNTGTTNASDFNDVYGNTNYSSVLIMSYNGWFQRTLSNDVSTEGSETIIMRLDSGGNNANLRATSATVTVNDTSVAAPTYSISPNTRSVNEGGSVVYTVTTTNVPNNTYLYWINYGSSTYDDYTTFTNDGTVLIYNNTGSFTRTLRNDITTEGSETENIYLYSDSEFSTYLANAGNVTINDTSVPAAPTYNETLTFNPALVTYPSGFGVYITGGVPNSIVRYAVDAVAYSYTPDTVTLDGSGNYTNTNAAPGTAVGVHSLYLYFDGTGHTRSATWTVQSASQTLSVTNYSSAQSPGWEAYTDLYGAPSATYDGLRVRGADQNSIDFYVQRTFTVSTACTISYRLTMSSENNYDFGYFYIDNVQKLTGSGTYASGYQTMSLSAGTHTVKVRYTKDSSVSSGTDEAFGEWSLA